MTHSSLSELSAWIDANTETHRATLNSVKALAQEHGYGFFSEFLSDAVEDVIMRLASRFQNSGDQTSFPNAYQQVSQWYHLELNRRGSEFMHMAIIWNKSEQYLLQGLQDHMPGPARAVDIMSDNFFRWAKLLEQPREGSPASIQGSLIAGILRASEEALNNGGGSNEAVLEAGVKAFRSDLSAGAMKVWSFSEDELAAELDRKIDEIKIKFPDKAEVLMGMYAIGPDAYLALMEQSAFSPSP